MCCFVILLLFNEMQMSVRRFSAIPEMSIYFCLLPPLTLKKITTEIPSLSTPGDR